MTGTPNVFCPCKVPVGDLKGFQTLRSWGIQPVKALYYKSRSIFASQEHTGQDFVGIYGKNQLAARCTLSLSPCPFNAP